jgi:hypothetical protein
METSATQCKNMVFAPKFVPQTAKKLVFLAGSIDKKSSIDWQTHVANSLINNENILFLNPTRFSWDSSWKLNADDEQFNEQVGWELEHLERADLVVVNMLPESQSPISLLEFGLYAKSGKVIVCCPEGFWKKGNVDMVCRRYKIQQVNTIEELTELIQHKLA